MRGRCSKSCLAVLMIGCLFAGAAMAAAPQPKLPGAGWPAIAGKPNLWTGLWEPRYWEAPQAGAQAEPPPLTPEYAARLQADLKAAAANTGGASPSAARLPPGNPRIMKMNYPYQFAMAPGQIIILVETYMQVRHIFMDGSPDHFTDGDRPFINGHSTGRWEGDTLVIDTVGIDPATPLGSQGNSLISVPIHHSDQLKVQERIRLVDKDTMEIRTTAEDPLALTRPWTTTTRLYRIEGDLDEYICEQNNRAFIDETGRQGVRLGE